MRNILLAFLFFTNPVFAQNAVEFMVEWHEYYWHSPMIQNKYPEWPKKSTIQMQSIDNTKISIYSRENGVQKIVILRQDQSFDTFVSCPNLLKPILFGMRADNTMVNIYSMNTFSTKVTSKRIKGSLNPNINYIPNHIKY